MKKYFASFLSIIMVFVALSACTPDEKPDNNTTIPNYFTTTTSQQTTSYTPIGYGVGCPYFDESNFKYEGEPVELLFEIAPEDVQMAIVIFVDGFLQPYSINGGEIGYFHKASTGLYTLRFTPVSGRAGENVQFVLRGLKGIEIDNPENQSLDVDEYRLMTNEHSMQSICSFDLKMEVDAPVLSPEVADDLTYIQDIEEMFSYAGVAIDDMHWTDFRIYDTVLTAQEDKADPGRITRIIVQKDTEHEIFICGYGKTGKYRVSLFINNELQYAFDGKAYLDMEIVENKQTTCSVKINTEGLNKNNYIYLLYCPLDIETDRISYHASKTYTTMLLVE